MAKEDLKVPLESVFYRRMDTLVACITAKHMYCIIPGKEQKYCSLDTDNNRRLSETMLRCKEIPKEEFEKEIVTDTSEGCFLKMSYLLELGL